METAKSSQTRLLYNPQLQTAEMTEKLFVVRQQQFTLLLNSILKEKENSIPQHHLIIGQRGMGKTTILKRMEVELHKEQYRQQFIPLLYREEQYNIKNLAEFWLNTLDALADSLQSENYPTVMLNDIDKTVRELTIKTDEVVSKEAYKFLMDTCRNLHRRPVLLIDNIDIVFNGLDSGSKNKQEQWALRKLLSENGAPVIISGGTATTDDVVKYDMPFYDFFKIQYLKKLNYEEFIKLLNNLATVTNSNTSVFTTIRQNTSRQKTLLELTGGSPRVTVMLFDQISKGFSTDINDDLNILVDAITPLYKAKFEELPQQQRTILDAIALNWDAISLRKLAIATRMKNTQLSPQLKRLIDCGWIETTPAYKDKGNAYFMSERFFNIYYLIRNSSRRHKDKIYCLSKFLECFYGKEELQKIAKNHLCQDYQSEDDLMYAMIFKNSKTLSKKMRSEFEGKIILMKNKDVLDDYYKTEIVRIGNKKILEVFEQGKYEKAIEMLTEIIYLESDNSPLFYLRGTAYCNIGNYIEAIKDFNKAIELEPNFAHIYHNRGRAYCNLNNYIKAIVDFSKVIELEPNFPDAYHCRGEAYYYTGNYVEAIKDLNKMIELNPDNADTYFNRGQAYCKIENYTESIKNFSKAIELKPDFVDAYINRATAYSNKENNIEALADYDKAIELNDANSHLAMINKGLVLIDLKMYREAVEIWELFLFNDSVRLIATFHLIFLYRDKLGKMERAVELFNSIDEQKANLEKFAAYCYYLNKAGFELYNQNKGLAKESLLQAFDIIERFDELATISNGHWWIKFSYIVVKLGYTSWLLEILEEKGYDIVLSPYYTAIEATEIEKQSKEDAEIYLNNRPVEISEPAREIVEKIRKYMD